MEYAEIRDHVFYYINAVRKWPQRFAYKLQSMRALYKPNGTRHRRADVPVITREGWPAVEEAISVLLEAEPLHEFKYSQALANAAQWHVNETGRLGIVGHQGVSEQRLQERLRQFGRWSGSVSRRNAGSPPCPHRRSRPARPPAYPAPRAAG